MDIDLNIDNYNLDEVLGLFNLDSNFNSDDLKRAYRQVLMTHPDKSGLDKDYFLFFSKAFKLVKNIYDYTHKKEGCVSRQTYNSNDNVDKQIWNVIKKQRPEDFNRKFNELFDKVKFEDEEQDTGYNEWFSSNEGIQDNLSANNVRDMNERIETIKQNQRALVVHEGIQDLAYNSGGYNLTRDKPKEYSSDLFSKLQYEDLKKAHTETVVPVTQEDYHNRRHFNNVSDLNIYRKQNERVLTQEESTQMYTQNKAKEDEQNVRNAYKMMKQMEQIERSHKIWNANFKLLTQS